MEIQVIRQTFWCFGQNSCSYGGLMGNVTHCSLNGIEFYVRENLTGIDTFLISSGERWGDKQGVSEKRKERQSLELLAPDKHWDIIAERVREADTLKRPVLKTRMFTQEFVTEVFNPKDKFVEFYKHYFNQKYAHV